MNGHSLCFFNQAFQHFFGRQNVLRLLIAADFAFNGQRAVIAERFHFMNDLTPVRFALTERDLTA